MNIIQREFVALTDIDITKRPVTPKAICPISG
jgi:hypothetical protein